jgi:hypothetical protein
VYQQFSLPAKIKTIQMPCLSKRRKNTNHTKISNVHAFAYLTRTLLTNSRSPKIPALIGRNASMSIRDILDQLDGMYGKPDTMPLLSNDMLFRSPFIPSDAPELLFYRIEQGQEIQVLTCNPYSHTKVNNAVRLLM